MVTTDTHVFFYSGREIYSNWHMTRRQFVDPLIGPMAYFDSSEQAFMWRKADFFRDTVTRDLIADTPDPAHAKKLGKQIYGYDDTIWETVRFGFMVYPCLLKFQQNPVFAAHLKATNDRILVEASPTDAIWGVGMSEEVAVEHAEKEMERIGKDCAEYIEWPGRNLLGKALMKVRSLI
jgi:hypothetical protein